MHILIPTKVIVLRWHWWELPRNSFGTQLRMKTAPGGACRSSDPSTCFSALHRSSQRHSVPTVCRGIVCDLAMPFSLQILSLFSFISPTSFFSMPPPSSPISLPSFLLLSSLFFFLFNFSLLLSFSPRSQLMTSYQWAIMESHCVPTPVTVMSSGSASLRRPIWRSVLSVQASYQRQV